MASAQKKDAAIPASIRESVERARAKAPRPDPVPTYLARVYREVMSWRKSDEWDSLKVDIHNYYKKHFHKRVRKDYFRFLIELSAGAYVSPQEKSKYVTVLGYARDSEVKPPEFHKFLRKQGGIKGCIKASKE
jgi:hypothetical protein